MKAFLKRIIYKSRSAGVSIGHGVTLDMYNVFEGRNVIGDNAVVGHSAIGLGTYISLNSVIVKTKVGRFCSIGSNVQTGMGVHPTKQFVSTHPAFFSTQQQAGFTFVEQDIFEEHIFIDEQKRHVVQIGNDVWIGSNVMIMDGVSIGDGAIVAAGAVVTKDVAPYTIVGGLPAKFIRLRFTEAQIARLLQIKWWDWSFEAIKEKSHLLSDIDTFIAAAK